MLSELAKNDLAALRQQGFCPTDEEVVKLNDIALRIERGKDTTPVNAPRVAFAGNIVLHEPTIGFIKWWYDFGKDSAKSDEVRILTYVFGLVHARRLDVLSKLQTSDEIGDAVAEWAKGVNATENEIWRAMMYVKYGESEAPELKDVEKKMSDAEVMDKLWVEVIAAAGALNMTPDDLRTCTRSELTSMLVKARMFSPMPLKMSIAQDYIEYRQLLREIEKRGEDKEGK